MHWSFLRKDTAFVLKALRWTGDGKGRYEWLEEAVDMMSIVWVV